MKERSMRWKVAVEETQRIMNKTPPSQHEQKELTTIYVGQAITKTLVSSKHPVIFSISLYSKERDEYTFRINGGGYGPVCRFLDMAQVGEFLEEVGIHSTSIDRWSIDAWIFYTDSMTKAEISMAITTPIKPEFPYYVSPYTAD